MKTPACTICERVLSARNGNDPNLIHEFDTSILLLGDHQFFPGYCLLLLKEHARELHELEALALRRLFEELMTATKAITSAFHPWKMNHASLGNQDPHVHWHLIPRYEADPDHRAHPWLNSERFGGTPGTPAERAAAIARIRKALS